MNTDPWLVGLAITLTIALLLAIGRIISIVRQIRKDSQDK
jgi:hypothetical protein